MDEGFRIKSWDLRSRALVCLMVSRMFSLRFAGSMFFGGLVSRVWGTVGVRVQVARGSVLGIQVGSIFLGGYYGTQYRVRLYPPFGV